MIEFLMHEDKDNVGVAVVDIKAGSNVSGRSLHGKNKPKVKVSHGNSAGPQSRFAGF